MNNIIYHSGFPEMPEDASEYHESAVMEFGEALRADTRVLDWQPRQAEDALKLNYVNL